MALSCLQARSAPVYKIREPEWLSPAYNNQGAGIVQLRVDAMRLAASYGSLFGRLIGWLTGWHIGWLNVWLAHWLACWFVMFFYTWSSPSVSTVFLAFFFLGSAAAPSAGFGLASLMRLLHVFCTTIHSAASAVHWAYSSVCFSMPSRSTRASSFATTGVILSTSDCRDAVSLNNSSRQRRQQAKPRYKTKA